jgi:tetratricopeptide (TPR) repeat protein
MLNLLAVLLQISTMPTVQAPCYGLALEGLGGRKPSIEGEAVCRMEYIVHIDGVAEIETVECDGEVAGFDYAPRARFDIAEDHRYGDRYRACRVQSCEPLPNFPHSSETSERAHICQASLNQTYTQGYRWLREQMIRDDTGLEIRNPVVIRQALEARALRTSRDQERAFESLSVALQNEDLSDSERTIVLNSLAYLGFGLGSLEAAIGDQRVADELGRLHDRGMVSDGVLIGLAINELQPERGAETVWQEALDLRPDGSARLALYLARAQIEAEDWPEARDTTLLAMRGSVLPTIGTADAHRLESVDWIDWVRSGRTRLRAVREDPQQTATLNLFLGLAAISAGRPRDGDNYFAAARETGVLTPAEDRLAALWYAAIQHANRDDDDAIETLEAVLEGEPALEEWEHAAIAEIYSGTGRFSGGLSHAVAAYRSDPESPRRASLLLLYGRELGRSRVEAALLE